MKVSVKGHGDFVIRGSEIKEANGDKFYAEEKNGILTLAIDKPGNNMGSVRNSSINIGGSSGLSVVGNTVQMNGVSIQITGKEVRITGNVNKIILNSKSIDVSNTTEEEIEDDRVTEYKITQEIDGITLEGSGDVLVEDVSNIGKNLMLTIQGSGDMRLRNAKLTALMATVQGSGDIYLTNVSGAVLTATVQGTGDIVNSMGSGFDSVMSTVQGTGDIVGLESAL